MKHIFTVHSTITFLVAYSTIKHLDLKKDEVLLISQKYKIPISDYDVIPCFHEARNNTIYKKLIFFNVPRSFDSYINEYLEGQDFIAYVDLMSYYQKILITHPNCRAFHFIEEGNSTYQEKDDIQDLTWDERHDDWRTYGIQFKSLMRVLRGYNLKLLSVPYIYTAYAYMDNTRFYAFSSNAFYNIGESKKILLRPFVDENIKKMAGGYALKNETIWLDGSNTRYTGLQESYYYDAIEKSIPILKASGVIENKVYVKLRPGSMDYSSNKLIQILHAHEIEVDVMSSDLVLEAVFIRSEKCNVIGVLTSSLEYAYIFGHQAYSIYGLFEKQPSTFFDRMTGFLGNITILKQ